ncbi:MAG: chromosome segregation protein SMC [Bradymonadaceae bacterium]|nr:chromosome segregation protein SMC [Lujinxingiaceae bacterium]
MKLRKIEIIGFKSFREKVVVEIGDGMTCIVGPNGCGKSNVVDAIKWAMGDASAKSLRGNSMQDVIFAGSENHKALGMAEVTLTFENDLNARAEALAGQQDDDPNALGESIPREFRDLAEIAITRRLFRSGESEYLINKVGCRLMDIQDLLAGTGVGKQGYSIIEQGQIGFIVNARPSQRRLIIEEASGITRYKGQRDRAERRLEQTEQNLARTRDVLEEINKQMKNLERQARRAEEHRTLSAELKVLEISALLERRAQLFGLRSSTQKGLDEQRRLYEQRKVSLARREAGSSAARIEAHVTEQRHTEATQNFYKLDTRLNLARSNRNHGVRSVTDARERLESLQRERVGQQRRVQSLDSELAGVREELAGLLGTPEESDVDVAQAQASIGSLRDTLVSKQRLLDEQRARCAQARARQERIDDRRAWIAAQLGELEARQASAREQVDGAREELEDARRAVSRHAIDLERLNADVAAFQIRADVHTKALAEARMALQAGEAAANQASAARHKQQARVESLDAMRRRGEGYAEGVQKVLRWAEQQGRADILGPAGSFLEVPEGWEAAAAAYLGERIGDIIVTSRQAAFDALNMLAAQRLGRIACFVLGDDRTTPGEVVGAWLQGLELVESLGDVPAKGDGKIEAWATARGDIVFANGRVVGGFVGEKAEGLLRQARQLEDLRRELVQAVVLDEELRESLELLREDATIVSGRLDQTRSALAAVQHDCRAAAHEHEAQERQQIRVQTHLERVCAEDVAIVPLREGLAAELVALGDAREALGAEMPGLQVMLEGLGAEVGALQAQIEQRNLQLTDTKVRQAQVRERRRSLEQSQERLDQSLRGARHQIERFEREAGQQAERLAHFEKVAVEAEAEARTLGESFELASVQIKAAKVALDATLLELQQIELGLSGNRREIEAVGARVQELEIESRESALGLDHVDEQLLERFGLSALEAKPLVADLVLAVASRPGRINYLRARIEAMGAVNALAIEEFDETRARKLFLEEQHLDLERAVDDLRKAIARMDRESKKRFEETFAAVNAKFQEVFPRLFRGGRARLTLTDPDDPLNTGVDIEVQPPGKTLQNVTLLSGGEKALTAVSLIFSIFLLKPTPFSILDEVDAPLDEANVGRFAEMVREMSATSQMIVITHNRRTMEAPRMLYGVTMEEPGVSKVVSVRLSDVDDRLAS